MSDVDGNSFIADLHSEVLMINGSDIGLTDNECVIPIFQSQYVPAN